MCTGVCLISFILSFLNHFRGWVLWHAISGTAPVGVLLSTSQQQARSDKGDVEPSDIF